MPEPSEMVLDLISLTITQKTAEGFIIKILHYSSKEDLLENAKIINNNLLRTIEAKQH